MCKYTNWYPVSKKLIAHCSIHTWIRHIYASKVLSFGEWPYLQKGCWGRDFQCLSLFSCRVDCTKRCGKYFRWFFKSFWLDCWRTHVLAFSAARWKSNSFVWAIEHTYLIHWNFVHSRFSCPSSRTRSIQAFVNFAPKSRALFLTPVNKVSSTKKKTWRNERNVLSEIGNYKAKFCFRTKLSFFDMMATHSAPLDLRREKKLCRHMLPVKPPLEV